MSTVNHIHEDEHLLHVEDTALFTVTRQRVTMELTWNEMTEQERRRCNKKRIIWYSAFVVIERNGCRRTYALRQVSQASMWRLWAVRDHCTLESRDFYKSVLVFQKVETL